MLYAYESQTPEIAATKVAGLKQHYGIKGTGLAYFELHGVLDVEHTRELGRALEHTVEDPSEAVAGATAGAEAIWGLLDGVARVRGIG
jgi:pyrroloquinoline-quinone synthase